MNALKEFQSLFWWILYCDLNIFILSHISKSFNPCFGGSYIVTCLQYLIEESKKGFNPCFGGSYIVTLPNQSLYLVPISFQSLFWWILYCDRKFRMDLEKMFRVSILVLVDLIL